MAKYVDSAGLGSQRRVLMHYRQVYYRLSPESRYTRNYTILAACMKVTFLCWWTGALQRISSGSFLLKYAGYQTEVSCVKLQVYSCL